MYVYFIATRNRTQGDRLVVKIGKAKNPLDRMSELQVGNPQQLRLLGKIRCSNDEQAYQTERHIHRIFKRKKLHGEWFALTDADVRMTIRCMLTATSMQRREEDEERRAFEVNDELDREFAAIMGRRT